MTIMTAKAYYDEERRKIEEGPGPMSENSGWFLKKRAKNLSRLGMDDAKPGAENPVCETKGFAGMRWTATNWEAIETATSSKLRKLDDDGCDARRLLDHDGWYCDEFQEEMAKAVVAPIRIPRRMARRDPAYHPKSPTSFLQTASRIRYAWGMWVMGSGSAPLMARTIAPGMQSAAHWGDNAAERWAEMCRREERIIQLKECRSKIVNRIEAKKESIQIEVNELDELEQELEKLNQEIGA